MKSDIAIKVENISKTFRIPHDKITTLRGAFVNSLKPKRYEEFKALNDVSFEVKKGEFFGIIGRNGSGKSTLLKILAGIYAADSGKVTVNGKISPFLELGIGFDPELSGRENIFLNGVILGLSRSEIEKKFDEIVRFSELERFIDQKVKNYSSGMQVRLAFSVAIHANREILLMDEVLAVGDANFQSKCLEEFNKHREMGRTVVLVTHNMEVVRRYCDRALLIRSGEVVKIADVESVSNIYIEQNIQDEEKKQVSNKEKEPSSTNEKNYKKKLVIEKVDFYDSKNNKRRVFSDEEDIVIRIFYRAFRKIAKPNFGVAFHTQDDIHLAGFYSINSGKKWNFIDGAGWTDFIVKRNFFLSGKYYVSVAIYGNDKTIPLDRHVKEYVFRVISKKSNQFGVIGFDHEWILDQ